MKECERKFLIGDMAKLCSHFIDQGVTSYIIHQRYSQPTDGSPVVRLRQCNQSCTINTKSSLLPDGSREEVEYPIPTSVHDMLVPLFPILLVKTRFVVANDHSATLMWEIDRFVAHDGREDWLAELELPSMDYPINNFPSWVDKEVTTDQRYTSFSIAVNGFPKDD